MESLLSLPSRGNFTEPSVLITTAAPQYVCTIDTAPPAGQVISTDPTNILIRSLTIKRSQDDGAKKRGAADVKGKRSVDGPADSWAPAKRQRDCSVPGGSSSGRVSVREGEVERWTVERLKAWLKERGLPLRGRKEELLARVKQQLK